MRFVVKRGSLYYHAICEGKPQWRQTRAYFDEQVAKKIAEQLVALGFTTVEAQPFAEATTRGRRR